MNTIKVIIVSLIIINSASYKTHSQILGFLWQTEKVALYAESNVGVLLTTAYGNGFEVAYGGGLEISPFKRILYIKLGAKNVHQFTKDNLPNIDIFTNSPDAIKMSSNYIRAEYGLKLRLDWWFKKIDYEGIHYTIGFYKIVDFYRKESSELQFGNVRISESSKFADYTYNGEFYEFGISWVFNDRLKWDSSLYAYYTQEGHSLITNGFAYTPSSKISIGINTGIYLLF